MNTLRKTGAYAAFYQAATYIFGIIFFLIILDYLNITEPSQKIALVMEKHTILTYSNIFMYILFGCSLLPFALALKDKFKEAAPNLLQVSTIIAFIWGAFLIASGLINNAGITTLITHEFANLDQLTNHWLLIESISNALGGGKGEILGGLFTFLTSIATFKTKKVSKILSGLGLLTGFVGIISILPPLNDIGGLFGILQVFWFIGIGFNLLKK